MSGYGPSSVVILNYGGNLAFWIPRISYWNSFEVRCRDAGGSPVNRVTSIVNSTQPSSSKAVTVSMRNSVTYGINSNTSEIYATVLYDSNNTGFYLDPNSTSNLNITQTGSLNLGNSSTYKFSTGEWAGSGGWPGYTYTGGDHRFGFSSTSGKIDLWTDGIMYAIESHRSPIFYDSDDTGYYVNPNSESKIVKLWINNGGAGGVGWSTGLNMGDGSNYWNMIQDGGVARQRNYGTGGYDWFNSGASQLMTLSNGGTLSVSSDMRAPIFYDVNDTGYYVDPNSTSRVNILRTVTRLDTTRINFVDSAGSQESDPYCFRWVGENDGGSGLSWLELQLNDDQNEEFRIYGYSCSGYGCGAISGNLYHRFDSSGNAWHAGNVTAYSDARVKDNITIIDNALDKVLQIRGVTYTRTDRADTTRVHAGVIAQEVEAVFPEVVDTDEYGMKSVAYGNMVGLLIESIKEQQKMIESQQKQIEELKRLIK